MEYRINGGVCLIDEADLEFLEQFSWHIDDNGYAKATVYVEERKSYTTLRMHQLLLGRQDGMVIDHINRNPLDNRKKNLRHVTPRDNWFNSCRAEYFFHKGVLKDTETYLRLHM